MARRSAAMLGVGAALAGGAALGFLAERAVVRGRLVPELAPADVPLGSRAGEVSTFAGPRGARITVETYGPEGAPELVLAHGWVCTGRAWHEQVARLAERYRIITYDQPGHARSSAPEDGDYDLDLLGDTFVEVVRRYSRGGRVVAAGHSLGGITILNAARRFPDEMRGRLAGVVLLSTTSSARSDRIGFELGIRAVARLERGIRRVVPTLRDPRVIRATERITASTSDLSFLIARWTGVGPEADPEVVAFTQEMVLSCGVDVVLGLVEAVLAVDEDGGLVALADVPTTLVVGSHDRLTPAALTRRMAERSAAAVVELEGVGHMSPLEAGDRVSDVLRRHLDGEVARAEDGRWELAGSGSESASGSGPGSGSGEVAWRRIDPDEAVARDVG